VCLRKQRAVGGDYGHETLFPRYCYEVCQAGMQQWFAHQMKIQEIYFASEFVGKGVEFLYGEVCFLSVRLRAKQTIEIADVGYFEIAAGNHLFGTVGVSTKLMKILYIVGSCSNFSKAGI
jgi:hypothetical protein